MHEKATKFLHNSNAGRMKEGKKTSLWLSFKKTSLIFISSEQDGTLSTKIIKDTSHEVRQHQHISSHQDIRLSGSLYCDVHITFWTAVLPRASVKVCLNSCWSLSHPEAQPGGSVSHFCSGRMCRAEHERFSPVQTPQRSSYHAWSSPIRIFDFLLF